MKHRARLSGGAADARGQATSVQERAVEASNMPAPAGLGVAAGDASRGSATRSGNGLAPPAAPVCARFAPAGVWQCVSWYSEQKLCASTEHGMYSHGPWAAFVISCGGPTMQKRPFVILHS